MTYRFAEIVDVSALQAMMESLWRASGIPTGIIEPDGTVLVATGWQEICTAFHRRHPVTAARCTESDASIAGHLRDGSLPECGYVEYRCQNGMVDIAQPILVEGHHLATLFLGQFFYDPPDETFFRRQAQEHGFETEAYLDALRQVPVFSVEKVRNILAFNARLVDMVSSMGVEKLRQFEGLEALRSSEEKFRALFESSNDATCIIDTEGRILEVNRLACVQLKRTRSELLSANMRQLLTADRSANFDNRIVEIRERGGLIFETEHLLPDGSYFPTEVSIRPITFQGSAAFLGTFRDISERLRAQQALRDSEERFRSIFNAAATSMGIISVDGRVLQVNPAACRFFGHPEVELVGRSVSDITHPDDRKRSSEAYREMAAGLRSAVAWEKRYLRRDGSIVWGHTTLAPVQREGGEVDYYVALTQDVTAQKHSVAALRESEQRLATLMGNLPGMAYRCHNDRLWTMTFVSDGCHDLTGYAPEMLLDNREVAFDDLIHEDDRARVWDEVQNALYAGRSFRIEYRIRRMDGRERWVWEQGREISGDEKGERVLEGFICDVTERKLAERSLRESDRMKSEFIRTAAHEFRTPLTAIQGFAQVLREQHDLSPEERREFLDYIHQRALGLGQIVAALLDVSRVEAGHPLAMRREPCTVRELVREAAPALRSEASGLRLEIVLDADGTVLEIDRIRVGQVLENLVSNAAKYSPRDGEVAVQGTEVAGGYRFSVIDRGRGMTPEQVDRVFESFYRVDATDTAVGGVGLGMGVARQIVEGHGGGIEVTSEVGKGTTVSFVLPRAGAEGVDEKAADC